jgi:hypothetical protein
VTGDRRRRPRRKQVTELRMCTWPASSGPEARTITRWSLTPTISSFSAANVTVRTCYRESQEPDVSNKGLTMHQQSPHDKVQQTLRTKHRDACCGTGEHGREPAKYMSTAVPLGEPSGPSIFSTCPRPATPVVIVIITLNQTSMTPYSTKHPGLFIYKGRLA